MKGKVLIYYLYHSSLLQCAKKRIVGFICFLVLTGTDVFGQYCAVDLECDEYISNVSFAGIENSSGCNRGYRDFTNLVGMVAIGEEYELSVSLNPYGYDYIYAFIDWNQNNVFDYPDEVYTVAADVGGAGPYRYTITVPADAELGTTRMRVMVEYNSSGPDPCIVGGWGEAEDYTITVGTSSACQRPTGFSIADISPSSVDLIWVGGGGTFELKWGAAGFDVDNEGLLVTDITASTQRISGLTAGTSYHAYVRRNCDTEGYSDWVGPVVCFPGYYYTAGDIPTRYNYSPGFGSDFCAPEPTLTIEVPIGYQLSGLTVKYDMVARNSAWKSEQASILYSTTLGVGEETVTFGADDLAGVQSYSRLVSFADGATGDVTFALRTWRTWDGGEGSGPCNTYYNYVPSGSWQLIPEFEPLPSCSFTSGLVVDGISRHRATVSWEAAGLSTEAYEYYYATTNTPPDAATRPSGEADNSFADLSDLDMGTTYYFWVRANCGGGDYSSWVGTSFTTSAPWSERFDTAYYYELPAGWQSPSGDWTVDRRGSLLDAESYFVNTYFSKGESRFMITNTIGPVETGDVFTFIYRNAYYNLPYAAAPAGSFEVTVAVSTDGGETFHEEDRFITDGAHGWQPFTLDMSVYAGEAVQLRIGMEAIGEIYSYYFGLDNFYVGPPQCPQPLNPSVSAVTPTSAVISWSEPNSLPDGGYQYYYAVDPATPTAETGPSGTVSVTSASLTDLSPGERYYFWIRAVCGEGVYGAWSIAGTFGTELELSSPWAEDFDASTAAPPGWETAHWQVNAGSDILNSDGNIVYSSLSNSAGNWNKTLTTPNIRVEAGDVFSFLYATNDNFSSGNPAEGRFIVSISEDYGAHYTDIETVTLNSTETWRMFSYALGDYEGKNVKVRIVAEYRSWSYQIGFDQFRVGPPSNCPALSTVSATTVGYTGAMVEWEDTGTDYEYYLVDSNTPPNLYTGSYERTSDTQVHLDDLEESKTYYFWIRAYCADDSHGEWGPLAMFTTPTQVSTPWNESFTTTAAPQGWEITGWQVGTNSYFSEPDGNAIYKELYYNFDVGQRTFTTLHVGNVQPGDQLSFRYQLTTYSSTPPEAGSGNFVVAIATGIGSPYIPIETVENNGIGGWQEFSYPLEDYVGETIQVRVVATWSVGTYLIAFDDFSIGSGTDCTVVTGLVASDITANSATLTWNEPVVAPEGYDYYFAIDETIPDAATEPSGSTSLPSVALTNLAPGQTYYWWVRAVCAEDTPGAWSAQQSFSTVQVTPTPWLEGFSSAATPTDWVIDGWSLGNHDDIDGGAGYLLYYNLYSGDPNARFTTPDVGIIQAGDELSFRFKLVNYYTPENAPGPGTGEFGLKISTDFGEHYQTLETLSNDGTTGWQYLRADLSDYAGEAIRIQVDAAQEGEADYYLAFDDFYVGPTPSCPPVVGIAISEQTTTTAKISWDEPDDIPADGYSYYISTSSTAPTESTVGHGTEQPVVVLADLIPATTYYVWVRMECDDDDHGNWGASASFTTGTIYYVREGASGTGDSWADASGVLQEVIDAANPGSEVWVAAGTYRPEADTGMPPRGFELKSGVVIYGGFPAGGGDWTQRDRRENQTVLKRHLTEELPIVSSYGVDITAVLDGFIITEGNASRGGGVRNSNASPTFSNLEIRGNHATWGGGVYNSDGSAPRFINVAITHNESSYAGAGMSNMDTDNPIILTNVVLSNNKTGNGYNGGAMENTDASLILTNVTIAGNTSENSAVYNDNSSVIVRNTIAWGNSNGYAPINGIRQGGAGNVVTVDYSLVEGLTTAGSRGNIDGDTDPGFLRAGAGDYRLQEFSPVIDAGNDGYFAPDAEPDLSEIDVDVAGNPRFYEGSTIDLGAYEYNENQPPLPITIRYVKTVANGGVSNADGRSWETASSNLQAMIDTSMEGDEVWVAAGDYHAVYYDRPHITFVLKEGVAVYGGFPANGGDENQRDWRANETILIGYSGGDYPVITNYDLTDQTILDGFIVRGGRTDRGGGIRNWQSSPKLSNLSIRNNEATWGGGIYNEDGSSPKITDVEISDNIVAYSGGGILNGEGANPILTRVVIRDNRVTASPISGGVAGGGGIFHQSGGVLKLTEVTITDNTSNSDGGGIYLADESSALYLENCHILGNTAQRNGGGLYLHRASTAATLVNTVIGDNQALRGGGVYNDGNLILLNATLGANKATNGGGLYHARAASAAEIENSIISGNYKTDAATADNVYDNASGGSVRKYVHSLVTGSGGSGSSWESSHGMDGGGNRDGEAQFLATERSSADFLILDACSPAIDAGNNELYENREHDLAVDLDAAGDPRLYGSRIDMGAYERQTRPSNILAGPVAGVYGIGADLTYEVTFTEPVVVTGIPNIPLAVGDAVREAKFIPSESSASTLVFRYQVAVGDEAVGGIEAATAIELNGGDITYIDGDGEAAELILCHASLQEIRVDGIRPELEWVSISSDNKRDDALAKPGDVVIVTFVTTESIDVPEVTVAGTTAAISPVTDGEEHTWQASYTLTNADEEGPVAFVIDFKDAADNEGLTVAVTTDGSAVTFDKTAPATPSSLFAERGDRALVLTWDINTEADFAFYRLYFGTDEDDLNQYVDVGGVAVNSYTHEALVNGTDYHYRIAALDQAGNESGLSDRVVETPKATQTITFGELESKTYGDGPFVLTAMASSELTVAFESSDPNIVSIADDGYTASIHKAGTVTIKASQKGNDGYESAEVVQQELIIDKAEPVIVGLSDITKAFGNGPFDLNVPTSNSDGDFNYSVDNGMVATLVGNTVTLVGAGDAVFKITQAATENYKEAIVVFTLTVNKAVPTLIWPDPDAIIYGRALGDTQLNATADVGGQFTYTPETGTVLPAGTGQPLRVELTPADADNYEMATAEVTIDVRKAKPVITWPNPDAITYGTALGDTRLNATADVGGQFTYTPETGTMLPAGTGQPLRAEFTPADADNYEMATAEVMIDVRKAKPVITWPDPDAIAYGTALDDTQLNAKADVAGLFTYTPTAGTLLDAGTGHPLTVTFIPDDTDNYEPVTTGVAIDVRKAAYPPALTVKWAGQAINPTSELLLTYGDIGELTISSTNSADDAENNVIFDFGADVSLLELSDPKAVRARLTGTATLTITQAATGNFEASEISLEVTVLQKAITLIPVAGQRKVYGDNDPRDYRYALDDQSNLAFDDRLSDIVSGAFRQVGERTGNYDILLKLEGRKAKNYKINFNPNNEAFHITQRPITVTLHAQSLIEKVFDGTKEAKLSAANYVLHGVLGNDDVSVSGKASYGQDEAGEQIPVTVVDFLLNGTDAGNYSLETEELITTGIIIWGIPGIPTDLSAIPGNKQVALSWRAPQNNGQPTTRYVIQYSTDGGQTWVGLEQASSAATKAVAIGLENNRPYAFRVAAANNSNTGPFSYPVGNSIPTHPVEDKDGNLPRPLPGKAIVTTAGVVEAVTLEVVDSVYLRLQGGRFAMNLASLGRDGEPIKISEADAVIRVVSGGAGVYVSGNGFASGTAISIYLFSIPELLGHIPVKEDGTFEGILPLPETMELGPHTLQANGIVAGDGGERSISMGVLLVEYNPQQISFNAFGDRTYGDGPIALDASSSSGLSVEYTVTGLDGKTTNIAVIGKDNKLHMRHVGEILVKATQWGDLQYATATPVVRHVRILPAPLDVFIVDATRTYGKENPVFEMSYRGFVNGEDASSLIKRPQATTAAVSISPPGTYVVDATGGEGDNYLFTYHSATLTIEKAKQSIDFNAPEEIDRAIGSIQLDVNADSGLPVTLMVDDPQIATVTGTILHTHRLGTVAITAVQEGDQNYKAAEPVTVTVRVVDPSAQFPIQVNPAVSPNGDGVNEFLMIEGIRDYLENRVTVINRNGTILWEANGYNNANIAFRGISTGQLKLSAGTYFYIVEIKHNGKWIHKKGYFVLQY